MTSITSILSSNYLTVGANMANQTSHSKYVAVDPASYQGDWTGKYGDNSKISISISNVQGFRAKVKYQSGSTVKYQDVLIRDSSFRIGDSKFTLAADGTAQIKTVNTNVVTGATSIEAANLTHNV